MGLGLADVLGFGRAMNAIRRRRQIDPNQSHWVVWSRLNRQLVISFYAFPCEFRVVVVIRIPGDTPHFKSACRGRLLFTANRRGVERDKVSAPIIGADVTC